MTAKKNSLFRLGLLVGLSIVSVASMRGQESRVLSSGVASPVAGSYGWYSVEADPENASNLITCGMRWDANDNANYGFVYSSRDAGKTWYVALDDKGSKWVSEESCAFGMRGVAYFVAGASKVDDVGHMAHEHGITRVWVSHDSGNSWLLATTTGWTDFSSSIVDRRPGPNQNRLYVFFNGLRTFYRSINNMAANDKLPKSPTDSMGLLTFTDGDRQVAGPLAYPEMQRQLYRGAHPEQNILLRDGSFLTFFWTETAAFGADGKENGVKYVFAVQRTGPELKSMGAPIVLNEYVKPYASPDIACWPFGPAVYDEEKNVVYATYLDASAGKCQLIITTSTDDGQTWSAHGWKEKADTPGNRSEPTEYDYSSFALARNREGAMGLLWRDGPRSNCWYFATSVDDGQTYSHPMPLPSCTAETEAKYDLSDAYLDFGTPVQADDPSNPGEYAYLSIGNVYNFGESHVSGVAVSLDGVFHPVWINSANGEGRLRTAAIAVLQGREQHTSAIPREEGWRYETDSVKFVYGGSQHYDPSKHVLSESVVIRNAGGNTLKVPLRLEVVPRSHAGFIYPLDVITEGSGQNIRQYLDVSQYVPGDGLTPGASSWPIPMDFHFEPYSDSKTDDGVASISLRLLTKEGK